MSTLVLTTESPKATAVAFSDHDCAKVTPVLQSANPDLAIVTCSTARESFMPPLFGRNVGTSSKMIDAYYSKIRPTDEIIQLIPDWSKHRLLDYRRKG